ncbi:MAG: DUF547 domain-containing protein, partial [Phycisphaerae bacterium]
TEPPASFDDADWATTLRRHVRDGLVDYAALANDRRPLERFVALLSVAGPHATPHLFTTRQQRLCYYINAYNALAVRAVLERWPTRTMYELTGPSLEHGYRFKVDGQVLSLYEIAQLAIKNAAGDMRVLFTLCAAARGCPQLAPLPYRPIMLERQLREAAARAVANPALVRIDHQARTLRVGMVIFNNRQRLIRWYERRYATSGASLLNALLAMADEARRQELNSAVGYRVRMLPFDRTLNARTTSSAARPNRQDAFHAG